MMHHHLCARAVSSDSAANSVGFSIHRSVTNFKSVAASICLLLVFGVIASAAPIGSFGFNSTGVVVYQNAGGTNFIDWCPPNTGSPATPSGCGAPGSAGNGTIIAQPGAGDFSTLAPNTGGTILDMTTGNPPASPYTFFPPTAAPLPLPAWIHNFLTLSGHSNWDFTANQLQLQTCTAVAGEQDCLGPFKLTQSNTPQGPLTSVTITVLGILTDTSDNSTANFRAIITGQYGLSISDVEALAQTPQGVFSNTVSASVFTMGPDQHTDTPEPSTYGLVLAGVGLIAVSRVRRNRSRVS